MVLRIDDQVLRAAQTVRVMNRFAETLETHQRHAQSGLRVERAADDAAGLSISETLGTQVRGLQQASKNLLDGGSLLNVADAAVSRISEALLRMRELAVQSANGTYAAPQRQDIEAEFAQLKDEINRVTTEADFNGFYLLRGGAPSGWTNKATSVTTTANGPTDAFTITPGSLNFPAGSLPLGGTGEPVAAFGAAVPDTYGLGGPGPSAIVATATDSVTGITRTIPFGAANGFTYASGSNELVFHGTGQPSATESVNVRYIPAGATTHALSGTPVTGTETVTAGGVPVANAGGPGGNGYWIAGNTISLVGNARPDAAGPPTAVKAAYLTSSASTIPLNTETTFFQGGVLNPPVPTVTVNGVPVAMDPVNGFSLIQTQVDDIGGSPLYSYSVQLNGTSKPMGPGPQTVQVSYAFDYPTGVDPLQFEIQAGANHGEVQDLLINRLTVGGLGLGASHADTQAAAAATLADLNAAVDRMTAFRANLGAYESSLDHSYANALAGVEGQAAARSSIRDADMAFEVTQTARLQIQQSGAMQTLVQINRSADFLMRLLS